MQLSKFSDYGFRILIFAGTKRDVCTTAEIAKAYQISQNHLVKIVHRLESLGLIATKKGKNGGFCLIEDPASIRLGGLLRVLEQNMDLVECFSRNDDHCRITESCRFKYILQRAMDEFIQYLDTYTLADLLLPSKPLQKILLYSQGNELAQ